MIIKFTNSEEIFNDVIKKLESKGLSVLIGIELEFYIILGKKENDIDFLHLLSEIALKNNLGIYNIEEETGYRQYEVSLDKVDIKEAPNCYHKLWKIILDCAKKLNLQIVLKSKPFIDQPACGLHIHLMIIKNNNNLLLKIKNQEENNNTKYIIGGLCRYMAESMAIFAPEKSCYSRYKSKNIMEMAPKYISWGGNNRSTSLRIPTSTLNPHSRHIEHRVPCPETDITACLAAITMAVIKGLDYKINPPEKIYGNAGDEQYRLETLPLNLEDAIKLFESSNLFKSKLIMEN